MNTASFVIAASYAMRLISSLAEIDHPAGAYGLPVYVFLQFMNDCFLLFQVYADKAK